MYRLEEKLEVIGLRLGEMALLLNEKPHSVLPEYKDVPRQIGFSPYADNGG